MESGRDQSEFIAFLDECGDHSLTKIDRDFPVFVLSLLLVRRDAYLGEILPRVNAFKMRYWDHEGVNLHSRDIRKAEGPFAILQHAERRAHFMTDLTRLMRELPYEAFVVGIHKQRLCERYADATNPYRLALTFVLERLIRCMEHRGQPSLPLLAESRGRNEDNELKAAFFDLASRGTQNVSVDRFQRVAFPLQFHDKRKNIAGIQLADLCAYPSARQILKPDQPNRAFDVIREHLYKVGSNVSGWKVFP